jgi:hypothetical protein
VAAGVDAAFADVGDRTVTEGVMSELKRLGRTL